MTQGDDVAAVAALAAGDLAAWHGLPAALDGERLEDALGPGGEETSGMLGGEAATYRTYPPAEGAPFGVRAWFAGSAVVALEIREPPLREPLEHQLGGADLTAASGLGPSYDQHVYGARGLALHVGRRNGLVRMLYAFASADPEQFLAGPIGQVEVRRIPL